MVWKLLISLSLVTLTTQHQNQVYPPGVPPPDQQHMHQPPPNQQYQGQPQGQQQQYQGQPQGQQQQYQGQQQQFQGQPQGQQQQGQQQQNLQYQQGQGQQAQQQYQPPPQQGQQANTQQFQQQPGHGHGHGHGNAFNQRENVHNQEHIKEHLKEVVDKPEKEMTDDELEFHYFKLHDYDSNNKLDGIEVTKAITHFHEEKKSTNSTKSDNSTTSKEGEGEEPKTPPKVYTDDELINIVDMVMKEDDLNNDGYIEYFEFVNAQRNARKETDKKS